MKNDFIQSKSRSYISVLNLAFIFLLLFACEGRIDSAQSPQSDTGSVSFNVIWEGGPNDSGSVHSRQLSECPGVSMVAATIYSSENALLKSGEWPCSAGHGTLSGVQVGSNLWLALFGRNSSEDIVYYGTRTGITVTSGATTPVNDIVAAYSMPTIIQPENGVSISQGPVVLQWNTVSGAQEYYFVVASDADFNNIVFDTTTYNTNYTLTGLEAANDYHWYVTVMYGDGLYGLETDVWTFSTTTEYTDDFS